MANADDADEIYVNDVLPEKMKYNLRSLEEFSFYGETMIMLKIVVAVVKRDKEIEDSVVVVKANNKVRKIDG